MYIITIIIRIVGADDEEQHAQLSTRLDNRPTVGEDEERATGTLNMCFKLIANKHF